MSTVGLCPREIELCPYVCAAMWGTAAVSDAPSHDSQLEGCEPVAVAIQILSITALAAAGGSSSTCSCLFSGQALVSCFLKSFPSDAASAPRASLQPRWRRC